ncbi:MAG: hypothetical protein ACQEXB_20640 [Bacillota bacterium]
MLEQQLLSADESLIMRGIKREATSKGDEAEIWRGIRRDPAS